MQPEERQEEPERRIKTARRSSILKTPKPRNPFEDIDVTETCTDISMLKPVRRVSFASKSIIKPFVADPEKNTIWDTTYEEHVNHTNSTQSSQSQEQILTSSTKSGLTLFESGATSELSLNPSNVTIACESTMELTNIALTDKENIPVYPCEKISIVDYAKKRAANLVPSQKINIFSDADENNATKISGMEFTCQDLNPFMECKKPVYDAEDRQELNYTIRHEAEMDLSENSLCQPEKSISEKQELHISEMDFTCHVPAKLSQVSSILEKQSNMEFTCLIPQSNQTQISYDMEFTCKVPQSNRTQIGDDMEFTCQVSQKILTKTSVDAEVGQSKLIKEHDMEFTCQVPPNQIKVNNGLEPNSKLLDTRKKTNDYPPLDASLPKASPQNYAGNENDAENVSQRDGSSKMSSNMENILQRQKSYSDMEVDESYLNQTGGTEIQKNMSTTCKNISTCFPIQQTASDAKVNQTTENCLGEKHSTENSTIDQSGYMEFTCQVPQKILTKTNVNAELAQTKLLKLHDDVEFTCQVPPNQITINHGLDSNSKLCLRDLTNDIGSPADSRLSKPVPLDTRKGTNDYPLLDTSRSKVSSQNDVQNENNAENVSQRDRSSKMSLNMENIIQRQKSYSDMEVDETYINRTGGSEIHKNMSTACENISTCIPIQQTASDAKVNQTTENCLGEKHSTENSTVDQSDQMEFTCQVPQKILTKTSVNAELEQTKLFKVHDDMEFTCQVPPNQMTINRGLESNSKLSLRDLTNDIDSSADNRPSKPVPLDTRKRTNDYPLDVSRPKVSPQNEVQNESHAENLNQRNISSKMSSNMEDILRQQKSYSDMEVDEAYLNQTSGNEIQKNMSTTCKNISTSISNHQSTCDSKVNRTIENCLWEKHSTKNSTVDQSDHMEFTCQVPEKILTNTTVNEELGKTKLLKVHDDMEFTCQVPPSQLKINDGLELNAKLCLRDVSNEVDYKTGNNTLSKPIPSGSLKRTIEHVLQDAGLSEASNKKYLSSENDEEMNQRRLNTQHEIICNASTNVSVASVNKTPVENSILGEKSYLNIKRHEIYTNQSIDQSNRQEKVNGTSSLTAKFDLSELNTPVISASLQQSTCDKKSKQTTEGGHLEKHSANGCNEEIFEVKKADDSNFHTPKKASNVSRLPIRTNSITKKQRISQYPPEQSQLELTSTNSVSEDLKTKKITIPAQKLPNLTPLRHELTELITPEPSFHINLTNISSGVDDTQHLLQCTYSKSNPFFGRSRLEDKDETGLKLNLEETGHVTKPDLSIGILEETCKDSPDTSVFDVPGSKNKLLNINDTYVLKNKKKNDSVDNMSEADESVGDNTSLGLITEDCLHALDDEFQPAKTNTRRENNQIPTGTRRALENFKIKEYPEFTIKRIPGAKDLMENINKQAAYIRSYLETFKLRSMHIPAELMNLEKLSIDRGVSSREINKVSTKVPTIEENIKKHQESCLNYWKLEKVDGHSYHFSTLFGTLIFVVELNAETDRVVKIQTINKLAANSKPIARYIMKLFLQKLDDDHIKSAIGNHCDVLSLLDYVQLTMSQLRKFEFDFMMCRLLTMEEDFVAKYRLISVPLTISCDILVDVSDVEHLDLDKDCTIVTHIGVVKESELRNLAKNSAKGLDFITSFHKNLVEYLGLGKGLHT